MKKLCVILTVAVMNSMICCMHDNIEHETKILKKPYFVVTKKVDKDLESYLNKQEFQQELMKKLKYKRHLPVEIPNETVKQFIKMQKEFKKKYRCEDVIYGLTLGEVARIHLENFLVSTKNVSVKVAQNTCFYNVVSKASIDDLVEEDYANFEKKPEKFQNRGIEFFEIVL